MEKMIEPGATLGVFGGGQLGRMFTHAAQKMGYRVVVFTDEVDSPASHAAEETIQGDYRDPHAVRNFAQRVDVITLEFENIAIEAVARAAEFVPVRPGRRVLEVGQHRIREKTTIAEAGFPVTPFREICSTQQILPTAEAIGWPFVLKTAQWGYDGKGQRKVSNLIEANDALELLGPEPLIAEQWIPFVAEVSVLVARSPRGELAAYPMFTNSHANHILDLTTCPPSPDMQSIEPEAQRIAKGIAETLGLEGLMCVEFFVTHDRQLMVNEIAPRPHNSGHLTIEACLTSQFEQQWRAVCGLPLGSTRAHSSAAMTNLLGELWFGGEPRWEKALARPGASLHLYGKQGPRPGRKMGHVTVVGPTAAAAERTALAARADLDDSDAV